MNIEVKHRTYTNNVHGSKYKEMMENAGKNMYGNKFISCKNTYTKHDKAHHSSSKIHSLPAYECTTVLYKNCTETPLHMLFYIPITSNKSVQWYCPYIRSMIELTSITTQGGRMFMHQRQMAHRR